MPRVMTERRAIEVRVPPSPGDGSPAGAPTAALPPLPADRAASSPGTVVHEAALETPACMEVRDFSLWYGPRQALHAVTMPFPRARATALIGPSGCGKSTLLRSLNRMNDLVDGVRTAGSVRIGGTSVLDRSLDVIAHRRRVGMVFQKPNPFPMSIFENAVYPLRIVGERRRAVLQDAAERSLRAAALWDEAKDRLNASALSLSGGQQQRLCIARAIAAEPEVLLMDEPCSALDPIATLRIEELVRDLLGRITIVIVTHNMQQAARVSDYTAFMYLGRLIEFGRTPDIFQNPRVRETEQYVTGRFG